LWVVLIERRVSKLTRTQNNESVVMGKGKVDDFNGKESHRMSKTLLW